MPVTPVLISYNYTRISPVLAETCAPLITSSCIRLPHLVIPDPFLILNLPFLHQLLLHHPITAHSPLPLVPSLSAHFSYIAYVIGSLHTPHSALIPPFHFYLPCTRRHCLSSQTAYMHLASSAADPYTSHIQLLPSRRLSSDIF